jgi:ABC-type spermidine/putrescine transport system permease subunit I
MAAIITAVTMAAAYPLAYFLVRLTDRWRKLLLGAIVLSFWTSGLLRAYAWMALLGDHGIINQGLRLIGLIDGPLPYLLYSPFAVVLVMTYFSLPFAVITIHASLEKMDWSLVNAAADLGARPMRAFWLVTLPLTTAGVVSAAILTFMPLMGMFFVPMLMGGPSSVMIAPLIASQMEAYQLGLGSALSFIVAFLVIFGLALAWRFLDLERRLI